MTTDAEDPSNEAARRHIEEVERLLAEVDHLDGDPGATAQATVEALVDLYGTVLQRVLGHVTHQPPGDLLGALNQDELVGHVLMAHGLAPAHPELLHPPAPAEEHPVAVTLGERNPPAANSDAATSGQGRDEHAGVVR